MCVCVCVYVCVCVCVCYLGHVVSVLSLEVESAQVTVVDGDGLVEGRHVFRPELKAVRTFIPEVISQGGASHLIGVHHCRKNLFIMQPNKKENVQLQL